MCQIIIFRDNEKSLQIYDRDASFPSDRFDLNELSLEKGNIYTDCDELTNSKYTTRGKANLIIKYRIS